MTSKEVLNNPNKGNNDKDGVENPSNIIGDPNTQQAKDPHNKIDDQDSYSEIKKGVKDGGKGNGKQHNGRV